MRDTPAPIRIGLLEVGQYDLSAKHGTFAEWFIPFLGAVRRMRTSLCKGNEAALYAVPS